MAQTVSNLADVMKEVWTQDRLEKQFYDRFDWLQKIEKTSAFTHGKKAVVPIHAGRSGGVSVLSSAGGTLNAAGQQEVDRAEYTVPYNYGQIQIQMAALNEATGGGFSVGKAIDLEVTSIVNDVKNQMCRQFLGDNTGLIAITTDGGNDTTIEFATAGYGYDALVRGWLYPGLPIAVGTAADPDSLTASNVITAVAKSASAPTATVTSAVDTTALTYVSLAGAIQAGGAVSNESDGLRNMAGSDTGASGGLDPQNAGEEFWAPAHVDTATTVLSLDLLLTLQQAVLQNGGETPTYVLTSLKQQRNFFSLLQNQARFQGSAKLGSGEVGGTEWNGLSFNGVNEVPDRELYFLTLEDFHIVTGAKIKKPTFHSDLQGANKGMIWSVGTTAFVDAVAYPAGLAMSRRNRSAAAIGLTA